jgi:hypothetical protein
MVFTFVVCGIFLAVVSLICWVLFLPFKILGMVFKGLALLLALPFLAVAALVGAALFGAGMLAFLLPALPFVLLAMGIWWLMGRRARPATG